MKFIVTDVDGCRNGIGEMPKKRYVDALSSIYKTWTIPFNYYGIDIEFFVVEVDDIASLLKFKSIVKCSIIIGRYFGTPQEVMEKVDSSICIYDGDIEKF